MPSIPSLSRLPTGAAFLLPAPSWAWERQAVQAGRATAWQTGAGLRPFACVSADPPEAQADGLLAPSSPVPWSRHRSRPAPLSSILRALGKSRGSGTELLHGEAGAGRGVETMANSRTMHRAGSTPSSGFGAVSPPVVQRLLHSLLLSACVRSSAAFPRMLLGCLTLFHSTACTVLEGLLPLPSPTQPPPAPPRSHPVPVAALGVRWLQNECEPCLMCWRSW